MGGCRGEGVDEGRGNSGIIEAQYKAAKRRRLQRAWCRCYVDSLPYVNPSNAPRISVITPIGTNDNGSFHPMMNTLGSRQINGMTIPFTTGCSFKLDVASIKPETIQRKKADRLASQVRPCKTIGITSSIPATIPSINPVTMFFFILSVLFCNDSTRKPVARGGGCGMLWPTTARSSPLVIAPDGRTSRGVFLF